MNKYPYYIVVARIGRLETPLQYRHTPIEKMFKSGKIGGLKAIETTFQDPKEAQNLAFSEERQGKRVEILKVSAPNRWREVCRFWRARNWNG